jgi:outer membrane protein assembly factor BamB
MRRPPLALALALALALLAPLAPAAVAPQGVAAGWREALLINNALASPAKAFEAFDTASLDLYDFNKDGQLEIVSLNDNNHAYVLDSRTGGVLAEIVTTHPGNDSWPVRDLNPISIGDLYGDGVPCMVIPNGAAYMSAWCYDASASTATRFSFVQKWEVKVDAAKYEADFKAAHPWMYDVNGSLLKQYSLGLDGNAFLADTDGDHKREVFVETDGYPGQLAFNADGTYRWSHSWYDGNAGPKVLDLEKDGRKDVCFATDAGDVTCYDAKTGAVKWAFHASTHGAYPGSIPVSPLYADLYGDGKHEVFFGARNAVYSATDPTPPSPKDPTYNANWMNETHAVWYLLDPKGALLWSVSYDWMNPLQYNHAAAYDVDGDGVLDLVALDWNTIGHKPGDWESTNRSSNLFALNGRDGSVLWHVSIPIYWSNKDFVIADADGDGKMDVITPEPKLGLDGIGVHDLSTGKAKGWFGLQDGWGMTRGPVAGDLYGDGKLYLVVPAAKKITDRPNYRSLDVGYRDGELHIIDTGQRYDVAFSANFLLSDDQKETQVHGTTGQPPTPVTPPPTVTTTPPTATTSPPPNTTSTPPSTSPPVTTTRPPTGTASTPPSESSGERVIPHAGLVALAAAAGAAVVVLRRR